MKKKSFANRTYSVAKILICCFLVVVTSCEELENGLAPLDNIIDNWDCAETGPGNSSDFFEVKITSDGFTTNGIKIYNLNHLGDGFYVKATVSEASISIISDDYDGFEISGSGTIQNGDNEITLNYTVDDGGGAESFRAVLTK